MRLTPLAVLFAIPLLAGCENKAAQARSFLGPTAVAVLESPTRIEAWRIKAGPNRETTNQPPRDLDTALARDLAAVLLDGRTYSFDLAKGCEFRPGVGLRVWRDKQSFDVILCFSCSELKIDGPDPTTKDRPYTTEDFDNARPALVALVKRAFPDDAEIQALK